MGKKKNTAMFKSTPQCGCAYETQNQIDEQASMQHDNNNEITHLYNDYEKENAYIRAESNYRIKNASEKFIVQQ